MSKCATKYHGEIEYAEGALLRFPRGVFGFETENLFLPLELPAARTIVFLQSVSTPGLCFLTLPVFVVDPGYRLAIAPDDLELLGLPADRQPRIGADVLCLAIVTVQEGEPTTANLMAPVVVNLGNSIAVQSISTEPGYSHRHAFLEPRRETVCS